VQTADWAQPNLRFGIFPATDSSTKKWIDFGPAGVSYSNDPAASRLPGGEYIDVNFFSPTGVAA
jgi:hypothetical protein